MSAIAQAKKSQRQKVSVEAKLSQNQVKPASTCFLLLIATIEDGWHINSSNPSDDNLVPTSVLVDKKQVIDSVHIQFPPALEQKFDFSEEPLEVYEGTINIFVRLEIRKSVKPGTYLIPATVFYQSCSNKVCLAPTSVSVNIPVHITNNERAIHQINKDLFEPYTLK
ncbi:MAG: protein-disulfide reductase DsbD domain-containing protein [bacterium]